MTHIGQAYKQSSLGDTWDAIIIGSGIGGLTAAALLASHAGRRVLVLERHYTAGGFTHTFHRPGYEWDVGVHYIGEVNDPGSHVRAAFDYLTGGRLQWNPMPDVYDRIIIDGKPFDFPTGVKRFRDQIVSYFPQESRAIDRYIQLVAAASRASNWFFAEKALPRPVAWLAGRLLRRSFLRYARQTTASVLSSITGNRDLIAVLTGQWGDYGLPPGESSFGMHAMVARHYFEGASYPVGGAAQIAAGIVPQIEAAGGQVIVSADVAQIMIDAGNRAIGVRMADGREFRAKTIISDAGALNTFQRLLPPEIAVGSGMQEQLQCIPPSMAHLSLYVGLKDAPATAAANLWICPTPDHDANFARFSSDPTAPFPVVFISFPSAKDPTFATRYPGHSTIEAAAPVPYGWFAKWAGTRWKKRGTEYDDLKQSLAHRLQEELERQVPSVRGHIDYTELSTPLTTRHFANYAHGEIYGLSAVPQRFLLASLGARTPVRNLYLTGADAASPGVTGALFGGIITASAILGRNLMSKVTRPALARAA